jgi:hypothetical protein
VAIAAVAAVPLLQAGTSGAAAATVVKPPTISTQFTPNQIGVGSTTGASVTYTITNPNASGSLYQVSFADTLPAGSTVDNPASVTQSGCGTAPTVAATPGAGNVTASGITVKAGTNCVISAAVTSNTPGTGSDAYTEFAYTSSSASYAVPVAAPTTGETSATLQVIGAPTVTVSVPKNNAVYNYGQSVKANYTCGVATGDDPTQLTCSAFDDLGNLINSGSKLDTTAPGKHELDIEALSGVTGASTDVNVDYTVLPNNVVKITKEKASSTDVVSLTLSIPGKGKLKFAGTSGKTKVFTSSATVKKAEKFSLKLSPTKAGKALLAKGKVKVKLAITYTPTGGKAKTVTKTVKL